MARKLAAQVHQDAKASADPACTYIVCTGASHIDEMVAELKRKQVEHYLVLCHASSDAKGEVCG